MSINAYKGLGPKNTPQSQPLIGGTPQVQNNAGGFVYDVGKWKAFERFLILGTEGGTYYVGEQKLTREAAQNTIACIAEDGARAVKLIVDVSDGGRAVKNDPAILALALAASAADTKTRQLALGALPRVCRIPTHLFHFNEFVLQFRGHGKALQHAIQDWYTTKPVDDLAYSMIKYQQRDGWSQRDLLRLWRPTPPTKHYGNVFRYFAKGLEAVNISDLPWIIQAFEEAKGASKKDLITLIVKWNLSREMVPTEHLKDPDVQEALLERMPPHALLRNLGNLSKSGLLKPLSNASKLVCEKLGAYDALRKRRVHPMDVLVALKIYSRGYSERGDGRWTVVPAVVDALNDLLYESFGFVEPTGKRILFGIDISGSMTQTIAGTVITAAEAAAVMALVSARAEKEYFIHGFTAGPGRRHDFTSYWRMRESGKQPTEGFVDLGLTPKMRLDDVLERTESFTMGPTDCSVPMLYATQHKLNVDCFVVLTDNETWAGKIHPSTALREYRNKSGIAAKQVVVGMTPTKFSIADPKDPLTLDVVGFDTATPAAISEFIRS